jgi:peptidoglycan/LPS O-acetylase OafA/YrhL
MHFPGLEVIRALAASMVVIHHVASAAGPRAGRLATPAAVMDAGVAVFFVLSGFLIFRPYAAALIAGRPGQPAVAFWWRRVLRIVPAYWVALSVLWAAGNLHLGDQWWRHYLLLQPFDRYTALVGLVPAWSLSTELCFYLLVPPLAAVVGRALAAWWPGSGQAGDRARIVAAVVVGVAMIGPVARATAPWWAGDDRALSFQWLPTNLDLFGAGMLLAVASAWSGVDAPFRHRADAVARHAWPWWGAAGVLFVAYAYLVGGVDFAVGYQGWSWQRRQVAFTACAVLLLVPAVFGGQDDGFLRRLWAWRPLVWVGTVSYGLYLWHVGVLDRLVDRPDPPAGGNPPGWDGWLPDRLDPPSFAVLLVATFAVALAVAALSWYLLERPLQRWKGALDGVAARG